ncbi:hypothetical protein EB809_02670 [Marinobacter sp. R17]|uniref:hypothetical protein n=1 Tax=Marinobacter sp. R17 TaxID=2484250 RepID=UPI000F4B20AE|nr:hypothetical protein [Marinobacter sp. R17]ROU01797.1 hypothetical protein EB809_02670 [Marinobacter sp. R17]
MFRKTLISLAVASTVGLSGCLDDGSNTKNANPDYKISNPDFSGKTWPIFNPITSELPIPNDLIFDSDQTDGTFGVSDSSPPVTTALNELSGASTVAPAVIQLNGKVDASTVKAGSTVFLIELKYASGDPVQALSNSEPPTIDPDNQPSFRADVETLDGTSAIRILPLKPLDPRKRYVVAVTTGIKDVSGQNIVGSPSYQSLTDEEQPLGNSALAPVRTLINSLWEPLVTAATSGAVTDSNLALTYSFTTSNDEKVLQYIAEPASWFADQLQTFLSVSAAKKVTGAAKFYSKETLDPETWDLNDDGSVTAADFDLNADGKITPADFLIGGDDTFGYDDTSAAVSAAVGSYPTAALKVALSPIFDAPPPAGCDGLMGKSAIACTGVALASNFSDLMPIQDDRGASDFTFDTSSVLPVPLVSAVTSPILSNAGLAQNDVLVAQGTLSLPYFLSTSKQGIVSDSWVADSGLAYGLNEAFSSLGLKIPQADPSKSTAVNYIFPFPKKQTDVEVPVLVLLPNPSGDNTIPKNGKTIIYQHGITTDRSAALTFGTLLAAQGFTVVAIDQPLHGVAAFSADEQEELTRTLLSSTGASDSQVDALTPLVLAGNVSNLAAALGGDTATAMSLINTTQNAGSTIPGIARMTGHERHFGYYAAQPSTPAKIDYENGVGDSGSLFINLTSFLTTRDNLRESAVDQMNLRASLSEDVTIKTGVTIPSGDIYFVGHSLGTITGTPFVAAVNANQISETIDPNVKANDITAASMLTPGGGIVRLLENSPTFAPRILLGLQQSAGLAQGDADLETYFNIFQATVDTADPVNFVDNLADQGSTVLFSEVENDTVIPNAADDDVWGIPALDATLTPAQTGLPINVTVKSFSAPLAGTNPLSLGFDDGLADPLFHIYKQADYPAADGEDSLSHGTPVSAQPAAAFGTMAVETCVTFGEAAGDCSP